LLARRFICSVNGFSWWATAKFWQDEFYFHSGDGIFAEVEQIGGPVKVLVARRKVFIAASVLRKPSTHQFRARSEQIKPLATV
jgi:hypothetical protein